MPAVSARAAFLAAAIATTVASPARAEDFSIPSGALADVAIALGEQARVTIVLADAGLAVRRSPGARGRMSLRAALDRALRGTGAEAVFAGPRIVHIREKRALAVRPRTAPAPPTIDDREILVAATKRNISLGDYPGSVKVMWSEGGWTSLYAAEGSAAITRNMPVLGSTNLGMGRNKLFIRGISDSSFSGPTQATTGQYLGDIRLTYNAPDPDLNLYDMERVEVLVGPQGTLYGAGSLGGIVRLVPNLPDPARPGASVTSNWGATLHGSPSMDGAAMVNVPLLDGRIALRLVGYGARAGGYIDAPQQGRRDINVTTSYGQRLAIHAADLGGWTVDLGQVVQDIRTEDGQYTLRGEPALTRSGLIAQPFRNDYRLGYLSATRSMGSLKIAIVASAARHDLRNLFDATGIAGTQAPATYAERHGITLVSNEVRVSGGGRIAPWVAGLAVTRSLTRFALAIDSPGEDGASGRMRSDQLEGALFGEVTRPIAPNWTLTVGGRATFARNARATSGLDLAFPEEPVRRSLRLSGTAAIHWRPDGPVSVFARYQQGHRPGGLGLTLAGTEIVPRRYSADALSLIEVGARFQDEARSGLSAQIALFAADWRNIQADLVSEYAIPHTANIGRGVIRGLDIEATWRPAPSMTISAALFLNDSRLRDPAPGYQPSVSSRKHAGTSTLPNVARSGGRVAVGWQASVGATGVLKFDATARYVGRSYLGLGDRFDIEQGNYLAIDLSLKLEREAWATFLGISNLGNATSNTFAYGNPVTVANRDQITPLRPMTLKLGVAVRY